MLAPRNGRSSFASFLAILILITLVLYYRSSISTQVSTKIYGGNGGGAVTPANATLGFGGLFVVSGPGSPRRAHLEEAATVTEVDFRIPMQVAWSDEDVRNFRPAKEEESRVLTGSVKAWLSHHLVLKEFLESGLETAVIFEDDVDWDIRLRTQQVPLAQRAVQSMSKSMYLDTEQYPWGTADDWDMIYIGNCGDYFGNPEDGVGVGHNHPDQLHQIPYTTYTDPTLSWRTDLHPFTAGLLTAFHIPEQTRVVHQSYWPLCTFAYAVTRRAAERILTEIAPAHEDPARNLVAYDAALMAGCRDGPFKCLTLLPELFHHMEGSSLIADEEASERKIFRPPVDAAGYEQVRFRRETSNIGCGFWDGSFYFGQDAELMEQLREEVGRRGRCLKQGRDPGTGLPVEYLQS